MGTTNSSPTNEAGREKIGAAEVGKNMKDRMSAAEFRATYGGGTGLKADPERKPQIRLPKAREPNKTEAAWMNVAKSIWPGKTILYEPFRINMPSGTGYTPDIVVMDGPTVIAVCEVKGAHIHNANSIRAFK